MHAVGLQAAPFSPGKSFPGPDMLVTGYTVKVFKTSVSMPHTKKRLQAWL